MKGKLSPAIAGLLALGVIATGLAFVLPHGPAGPPETEPQAIAAAPAPVAAPPPAAEAELDDKPGPGPGDPGLWAEQPPPQMQSNPAPDLDAPPAAAPAEPEQPAATSDAAALPAEPPRVVGAPMAAPDKAAARLAELAEAQDGPANAPGAEAELVAPAVRNVTPPGMTPGPQVDGPMVRQPVPDPPPLPPRWRRFFKVVALDAGTLDIGPRKLKLADITAPAADAECTPDAAPAWPCGRAALTAFRLFLRGRAIECFLPPETLDDPVTGACRLGAMPLADWLVKQGWAEPTEAAPEDLQVAARAAHCAGAGIWRGKAAAGCPATPQTAAAP